MLENPIVLIDHEDPIPNDIGRILLILKLSAFSKKDACEIAL